MNVASCKSQVLGALHLELFPLPPAWMIFYEIINLGRD